MSTIVAVRADYSEPVGWCQSKSVEFVRVCDRNGLDIERDEKRSSEEAKGWKGIYSQVHSLDIAAPGEHP